MIIRRETTDDYRAVYDLHFRAFGEEDEARLVEKIRQSAAYVPELSLVADMAGQVVGHIMFSRISISSGSGEFSALALAPMAVLPGYQNKGIGSLLVMQGLQACRLKDHKIVVVVGHPEYYPRFGFVPARSKGLEVSFEVPDSAFMVIELSKGALEGKGGLVKYSPSFDEMI